MAIRIKYLIILSFLISSNTLRAQNALTIKAIEKLVNEDYNKFESYTLSQGYEFVKNNSGLMSFKKGTRYLQYLFSDKRKGALINYTTPDKAEYLKLKNECLKVGYEFFKTETFNDGQVYSKYKSNVFILSYYLENNRYNISISKIEHDKSEDIPWFGSSKIEIEEYLHSKSWKLKNIETDENFQKTLFYIHPTEMFSYVYRLNAQNLCNGFGRQYLLSDEKDYQEHINRLNLQGTPIDENKWLAILNDKEIIIKLIRGKNSTLVFMTEK
jgi:hypothetical protein